MENEIVSGASDGGTASAQRVLNGLVPSGPAEIAQVAVARTSSLFLGLDRSDEAFAVMDEGEAELAGHPAWQAECRSVAAQALMFAARYDEAGRLATAVLDEPNAPESEGVRATPGVMNVRGADGRLADAPDLATPDLADDDRRHRHAAPSGAVPVGMAQVRKTGEPSRLEPMDAFERKIMHDLVARTGGVRSASEGVEPRRRVVVYVDEE